MGSQVKLKKLVVLCIFLLISGCTSPPAAQTEKNTSLAESVDSESEKKQFFVWGPSFYSSIVDIYVYAGGESIAGGTGTIISEDGLIITNQHVVVGGDEFEIYTYGTYDAEAGEFVNPETNEIVEPLSGTLMGSSQCNDIAVLQIDSNRVFNYLEWYGEDIMPGLEIYTLGYPGVAAGEIAVTTGVVSYINSLGDSTWTAPGYNTFAHTSPIFSGNSGGPVVTAEGKLVGINYLTEESYDEAFPISKAINNNYVKDIVDNYLSKGINYTDIGIDSSAIDLYWFLPQDDERSLTMHYIEKVQPGSIGEIASLLPDTLLLEVGNNDIGFVQIGTNESSYELCNKLEEWEDSSTDLLNYIAYSCDAETFYKGYISKQGIEEEIEFIENPYEDNGFTLSDFQQVCLTYYEHMYGY